VDPTQPTKNWKISTKPMGQPNPWTTLRLHSLLCGALGLHMSSDSHASEQEDYKHWLQLIAGKITTANDWYRNYCYSNDVAILSYAHNLQKWSTTAPAGSSLTLQRKCFAMFFIQHFRGRGKATGQFHCVSARTIAFRWYYLWTNVLSSRHSLGQVRCTGWAKKRGNWFFKNSLGDSLVNWCAPGQHTAKDEESARNNHVLDCNFVICCKGLFCWH